MLSLVPREMIRARSETLSFNTLQGGNNVGLKDERKSRGKPGQGCVPPYSPDFNPIENAFAKLKALLRKAAERTVEGLWSAIGQLINLITPQEIKNLFAAAGYDAS
jgi:hypothetical protein